MINFKLLLTGIVYLATFIIASLMMAFILINSWGFLLSYVLEPIHLEDILYSIKAIFTFAFLVLLLINSHLARKVEQIKYSKSYLNMFELPEQAVCFWLNLRFYLSFIVGIIFVSFSIYSLLNLCFFDITLQTPILEPDNFFGKYLVQARIVLGEIIVRFTLLAALCYLLTLLARKEKELAFLQALLHIAVTGSLLLLSYFNFVQLTMVNFLSVLLLASILASLLCLMNTYIEGNLSEMLQKVKSFALLLEIKNQIDAEKKQFLLSFVRLALVACSNCVCLAALFRPKYHILFSYHLFKSLAWTYGASGYATSAISYLPYPILDPNMKGILFSYLFFQKLGLHLRCKWLCYRWGPYHI